MAAFRTWCANAPVAAARVIDSQAPDVVIVDFTMPEVDGLELTKAIRLPPVGGQRHHGHRPSPRRGQVRWARRRRRRYITKPFEPAKLIARIQTVLRRARELRAHSPLTGLPRHGRPQAGGAAARRREGSELGLHLSAD